MSRSPDADPLEMDCRDVRSLLDSGGPFVLLDCRERDEYEVVRIDPARLIPMSELAERVAELEPFRDGRIIVYCHHGIRSLQVAMWLRSQGYAGAVSMSGGIDRWATDVDRRLPRY